MWDDLLRAIALMLVFEGMLPFVAPRRWRLAVQSVGQLDDRTLRLLGLVAMVVGVVVLYMAR